MTILVTGGAGFIGSHMVKRLLQQGVRVVVVDDLSTGHRDAVAGGVFVEDDLSSRDRLIAVMRAHAIEGIIHFAGRIAVGESVVDPGLYYRVNVGGTITLLEAAVVAGVERFVFSSTAAVYGQPDSTPIPVDHPIRAINPYGASKAFVERILADFETAHGLRFAALRYFNAAGADPEGALGERHDPETHLIPLALEVAAGRRSHLQIFGTDYGTPDGTCVRDYVHVWDLCEAHLLALEWLAAGQSGSFNLGNGAGFSVLEVVRAVEQVTGVRIPVVHAPRRAGDPSVLVADAERSRRILGWAPRYAALETMVQHAWQFMQRNSMMGSPHAGDTDE